MTLTYPIINRSRRILWLVTGIEKSEMLPRLLAVDESIPAGRVRQDQALVLADPPAALLIPTRVGLKSNIHTGSNKGTNQ